MSSINKARGAIFWTRAPSAQRPEVVEAPALAAALRVREVTVGALTASEIRAWAALEGTALEPNAYASPHFVLPALRHLDPGLNARILFVEQAAVGQTRVVGVLVSCATRGSRLLPLPHFGVYQSRHSYLGGPLLDRGCALQAAGGLLDHMRRKRLQSAGLVLPRLRSDGPLMAVLRQAAGARGLAWHEVGHKERAVLAPAEAGLEALKGALGKKHKEVERCRRRIAEHGELQWHCHRGRVEAPSVEAFLRLEHSGWKAETGTSLRSQASDEAFFREMVASFSSEGRALFTELTVNGAVIASTSNMISGNEGFAFKVGWDQDYRRFGVGILNEAEFVQRAPELCADIACMDSGSEPASFIEQLWPGRRTLTTAFCAFSAFGDAAWRVRQKLRRRGADVCDGEGDAEASRQAAEAPSSAAAAEGS